MPSTAKGGQVSSPPAMRAKRTHEQIAEYYATLIQEGRILPGYRLPSVEQIRITWTVGRETAHKALRHLETQGLVEIRPKQGTFALPGASV